MRAFSFIAIAALLSSVVGFVACDEGKGVYADFKKYAGPSFVRLSKDIKILNYHEIEYLFGARVDAVQVSLRYDKVIIAGLNPRWGAWTKGISNLLYQSEIDIIRRALSDGAFGGVSQNHGEYAEYNGEYGNDRGRGSRNIVTIGIDKSSDAAKDHAYKGGMVFFGTFVAFLGFAAIYWRLVNGAGANDTNSAMPTTIHKITAIVERNFSIP
jgi:hypothetical protein